MPFRSSVYQSLQLRALGKLKPRRKPPNVNRRRNGDVWHEALRLASCPGADLEGRPTQPNVAAEDRGSWLTLGLVDRVDGSIQGDLDRPPRTRKFSVIIRQFDFWAGLGS